MKSMEPNGDCGYELMCRWMAVHAVRSRGGGVPRQLIDEAVPADEVYAMRQAIAEEQERQTLQKCNAGLRTMIGQSMFDWWRSPLENGGRNSEVAAALKDRPAAVPEMDWLQSDQSIALHSTLVRTRGKEVFAEAAELETFSLMLPWLSISPVTVSFICNRNTQSLTWSILWASAMVITITLPCPKNGSWKSNSRGS